MSAKTVLITGASRGIGKALALAFAKAGYVVGVNARQEEEQARAVVKEIQAKKGKAAVFLADIRDSLKVRQMIDQFVGQFGSLDVLINNAGISRDRTILKMTNGEWNEVIDTNLNGVFWCLREGARVMSAAKKGAIINVSSIMAARPQIGVANYAASKAGVLALTKTAARELGRFSITVNAVLPGFHKTDMNNDFTPEMELSRLADHVLGRTTTLEDLSRLVIELAENKSVSGQIFNVDSRILA